MNTDTELLRKLVEATEDLSGHNPDLYAQLVFKKTAVANLAIECLPALSRLLEAQAGVPCEWSPQNDWEDDSDDRMWNSGCGHEYYLGAGNEPGRDFEFCMYCGAKSVIEHPPSEGEK